MKKIILHLIIVLFLSLSFIQALSITEVDSNSLVPGQESNINLKIKNSLNDDVEDVSVNLIFAGKPFIPVGSSEDNVDEILDGDTKKFSFRIRASNEVKAGDYEIPYTINYRINNVLQTPKTGTIGISVKANPVLDFSLKLNNPVVNNEGSIELKIINKGLGDARFVSVKANTMDYSLLSEEQVYIGNINSDDFETATFEVIFNKENGIFSANIEYVDYDNKKITTIVNLPLNVYTKERAIQLGIIKRNNSWIYLVILVILIMVWAIYRSAKKKARIRRAREANRRN